MLSFPIMPMPKITINKNDHFILFDGNVRGAQKAPYIFSIPYAPLPQRLAKKDFRLCLGASYMGHAFMALFGG
jgi:hypothetical protein